MKVAAEKALPKEVKPCSLQEQNHVGGTANGYFVTY